jgi:hypothetical protein
MRSMSQGGKFIHGFVAGAIGAASGMATMPLIEAGNGAWVGSVFISAALGGTASILTGGNFANGAVTAAFVTLFNTISHSMQNADTNTEALSESEMETLKKNIKKAIYSHYRRMGPDYKEDENGTIRAMDPVNIGDGLPQGHIKKVINLKFGDEEIWMEVDFTVANNPEGHTVVNFGTSNGFASLFRINLLNSGNSGGGQFGFLKMGSEVDYKYVIEY